MVKAYEVEINNDLSDTIYYPNDFNNTDIKTLAFGRCQTKIKKSPKRNNKNILTISGNLARKIHFYDDIKKVHLFTNDETLHIGPLLGIFTTGIIPIKDRPFGDRTYYFEKLLSLQNLSAVIPFIFTEEGIDWEQGLVKGLFYKNNEWSERLTPLPDVIYDRIPNRRAENKKQIVETKEKLQNDYLIEWFNPGFFNKLHINELLLKNNSARKYIAETRSFRSKSDLQEMLVNYRNIYVKPINGSHGKGIYQINLSDDDKYIYCRSKSANKSTVQERFKSVDQVMDDIFINYKLDDFIIQREIKLLQVNGRKIDFRLHTNKDRNGKWVVSALAGKVASHNSPTTHLNNGGTVKTVDQLFPNLQERNENVKKLIDAALLLSEALDDEISGTIGEIGFDFGIDTDGNVFLFEANSKPGRAIFVNDDLYKHDLLTRKLTLTFPIYLTEKSLRSN